LRVSPQRGPPASRRQGRDYTNRPAGRLFFPAVQENRIELDRSGGGVAVLSVQGEHDVYTAPSLTEQVEGLIDERVPFVIDLTPATFVDSSVLRVLLEARRRAEEEGVGFAVALDQDDAGAVRRVLEVTGLIPVLPVHPARDAAMEAAKAGSNSE
jgi:anti-sigma B factor antagonist